MCTSLILLVDPLEEFQRYRGECCRSEKGYRDTYITRFHALVKSPKPCIFPSATITTHMDCEGAALPAVTPDPDLFSHGIGVVLSRPLRFQRY